VVCEDIRQEFGHPFFDSIRVRIDQRADAENGCVTLTDRFTVTWRLAGGNMAFLCQIDEAVL
jgi:hypothetical protein